MAPGAAPLTSATALRVFAATLVVACLARPARAHVIEGVGDYYAGVLHPVTSLASLLPWLALALLAGQQDRRGALRALAAFPAALVVGACVSVSVGEPCWVATANLVSIPVLGGLVAWGRPLSAVLVAVLAALVGLAQGLANGAEVTEAMSAWRFVPGVATTGLVLTTCVIGLVRSLGKPWQRTAVRVAGSWIAAIGVMVLAFAL